MHFNVKIGFWVSYSKCCEILKRPSLLFYIKDCACFGNAFTFFHPFHLDVSAISFGCFGFFIWMSPE
jgi:hypothetical protein